MKKTVLTRTIALAVLFVMVLAVALPALAATTTYVQTTKRAIMRASASSSGTKLTTIPKGEIITKLGVSGIWTQVQYGSYTGYVTTNSVAVYTGTGTPSTGNDNTDTGSGGTTTTKTLMQATGNVNVRSGPGTNYSKLGQLKKGTQIYSTSQSNGWAEVEYDDGTAYVSMTYLKTVSGSGSSSSAYMEATANVNVRSGPSTSYSKLGQLKKGDIIPNDGTSGKWVKTTYNGQTAYVHSDYLKASSYTDNSNTTTTLLYALQAATIYTSASAASSAIAYLDRGDSVTYVSDYSTSYYKVQYGSRTGYVIKSEFSTTKPDTTSVNGTYYVSSSTAYYYSTTSTSSAYRLGSLSRNTQVYVSATSGSWAKIYHNNQYVYMQLSDLSTSSSSNTTYYVSSSVAYYYSTMSASSAYRLGSLSRNTSVTVVGTSGSWAQVNYGGQYVYMELSDLSTSSSGSSTTYYVSSSTAYYYSTTSTSTAYRLGSLSLNTQVTVVGTSGSWAQVYYGGQYVYMQLSDLSSSSGGSMTTVNAYMYATIRNVPCYSTMTASSTYRLGYLDQYEAVYVYAMNASWARCLIAGQTMYVQSSYLSYSGGGTTSTGLYYVTQTTQLFSSANTSAASIGTISRGEAVTVLSLGSTWAQVLYNGNTVYMYSMFLSTTRS